MVTRIALLLSLVSVLCIAGCGSNDGACEAIAEACHGVVGGEACHETAEGSATTDDDCAEIEDDCMALCSK